MARREQLKKILSREAAGRAALSLKAKQRSSAPKVSVIVTAYNSEETIARCLNSVLGQTFKDIEVIVIDDGSSDNTVSVIESVVDGDERVRLLTQPNRGVARTRNRGLDEARGEWIYFVDSDDGIVSNAVELMYNSAIQEGCDLVVCDFWRCQNGHIVHKGGNPTKMITQRQFVKTMSKYPANLYYACLWNKFLKRDIVKQSKLDFDPTLRLGEDHMFVLEYLRSVKKIGLVGEPLYYYNDTPGSLVHQGMNPVDIGFNKAVVLEKFARLCTELDMASSPMELFRIARFLITPSWDYLVLPLPSRNIIRHVEALGESGYSFDALEDDQ